MQPATVLVADDDQEVLHFISNGLKSAGFETLEAGSVAQAGQLAREHKPDLTILDPLMPLEDALEVAASLREADLPFIALSSADDEETVDHITDAGALAYLVKPVDIERLVPLVRSSIRRGAEIRELRASLAQLDRALSQGREVSIVVGILMERCNLTAVQAFDALRDDARSQRKKIADLAREMLSAAETLHGMTKRIEARADGKAQKPRRPQKRFPARAV